MAHVVWFRASLRCHGCGAETAARVVDLFTSGLGRDPLDTRIAIGDVLEIDRDDFADAYLSLHVPGRGERIRALEQWGCKVCGEAQWAILGFEALDDEHHRFVEIEVVPLSAETLRSVHYASTRMDLWIEAHPGALADEVLAVVGHLMPRSSSFDGPSAARARVRALVGLHSPAPHTRAVTLRALLAAPDPAPDVVAAVEALLEDATPTILSLPIRIGEVRHLAAEVLAATRALSAERRNDIVVLDPGYRTLSPVEIGALAAATGCDRAALDPPGQYAWLRDHGKLERRRLEFHPLAYVE